MPLAIDGATGHAFGTVRIYMRSVSTTGGVFAGSAAAFGSLPTLRQDSSALVANDFAELTNDDGGNLAGVYRWDGASWVFQSAALDPPYLVHGVIHVLRQSDERPFADANWPTLIPGGGRVYQWESQNLEALDGTSDGRGYRWGLTTGPLRANLDSSGSPTRALSPETSYYQAELRVRWDTGDEQDIVYPFRIDGDVDYDSVLSGGHIPLDEIRTDGVLPISAFDGGEAGATGTGAGAVQDQGEYASVALANAGIPVGGVPVGETYQATSGGQFLIARAGATSYSVAGSTAGSGDVTFQGSFDTEVLADAAVGFPGTPVPAGQKYLAFLTTGETLYADEAATSWDSVGGADRSPNVIEISAVETKTAVSGDTVIMTNGSTLQLPAPRPQGHKLMTVPAAGVTLIEGAGGPVALTQGGATIDATIPWSKGPISWEYIPSATHWQARAEGVTPELTQDPSSPRTANFTAEDGIAYQIDSSGGPVVATITTAISRTSMEQVAGTQGSVSVPVLGSNVVPLADSDWILFEKQPNDLFAVLPYVERAAVATPTNADRSAGLLAATAIPALSVVRRAGSGRVSIYNPVDVSPIRAPFGISVSAAAAANDPIEIVTDGEFTSSGAFTADAHYWVAPDGSLQPTHPTSDLLVYVGYAPDADTFVVDLSQPPTLLA